MRVISGSKKGHKLKGPKNNFTRPTEDRVKESIFNILGSIKENSIVLDAFSGTGSIGIEFLSRGAGKVYFIEKYRENCKIINDNLIHTKLSECSKIIPIDIRKFLKKNYNLKFDYIYIDPPYNKSELLEEVFKLLTPDNLKKDSIVIVENPKGISIENKYLKLVDYRSYKSKNVYFYVRV